MTYLDNLKTAGRAIETGKGLWNGIDAEAVARMRLQNRFKTGLDIAKYTAKIMREDMAAYDADPAHYTQSLGCWHGFIAQQKLMGRRMQSSGAAAPAVATRGVKQRRAS